MTTHMPGSSNDDTGHPLRLSNQVTMPREDYEGLPMRILRELLEQSGKPYGMHFVRNEDGGRITDAHELYGALHGPLTRALKLS